MRTLMVTCVVALVVAVGMAFAMGLVEVATSHPDGKCVMTITLNTYLIHTPTNALHLGTHESHSPPENATHVNGKITAVRPAHDELVLAENSSNWTFHLAKDGKVLINDRESKLADLREGDDATVSFERQGSLMMADLVRAVRK